MKALLLLTVWLFPALAECEGYAPLNEYMRLKDSRDNKHISAQLQFSEGMFFNERTNTIGSLNFVKHHQFQRQPYVANGYIGARIPNLGQGYTYDLLSGFNDSKPEDLINGWPQFNRRFAGAFAAGFYNLLPKTNGTNFPWLEQHGLDSMISAIPQWTSLTLKSDDGHELDPALGSEYWGEISNYSQTLCFEDGIVSTLFKWMDKLNLRFNVTANKKHINVGTITVEIQNPSDLYMDLTVTDTLDLETSNNCKLHSLGTTKDGIFMMFSPLNVKGVFGAISSRLWTSSNHTLDTLSDSASSFLKIQNNLRLELQPNETVVVHKFAGIVTTDLDPIKYSLANAVLEDATEATQIAILADLESDNKNSWKACLGQTLQSVFPDEPLLTLATRASIYHLHSNTRADAMGLTSALGVSGLSADSYGGQVFWDTDLWILMGILPFSPGITKSLLEYRHYTHQQAIDNIQSPSNPFQNTSGAVYPWTSGRYGNCTASGPCFDYEYHVNSAIAHSAFSLYLNGAVGEEFLRDQVFPIIDDAAQFYSTYVNFNDTLQKYTSHNLTDPDEFANNIDNGAYTNAAISKTIEHAVVLRRHFGLPVSNNFKHILENMYIPTSPDDERITLEYSNMPASAGIKQADVVMMTYPFEYVYETPQHAQANLDYYALKQVSTGPAMTNPIYSIVSSAILQTGCSAESYLMKSVQPYLRGPFAQFLEQSSDDYESNGGTHPAFPFLTAHGGFLQAILYGILGIRFGYEIEHSKISRILEIKAHSLSMMPNGVFFPEVQYMNQSLSFNLSTSTLTIENNGRVAGNNESISGVKLKIRTKDDSFLYKFLQPNESFTIDVSARAPIRTESLTECGSAWFTNIDRGFAGDVMLLMHDGSNSTKWKAGRNSTTKILIDLKTSKTVEAGFINWGPLPPKNLRVYAEFCDLNETNPELQLGLDMLAKVSFGPRAKRRIQQDDIFREIYSSEILINAPYDELEAMKIKPVSRYNTTNFDLPKGIRTRFLLIEIDGIHDENVEGGAEVYSLDFFQNSPKTAS